ncbi:MAG: lytic murein transglycosylase [Hyphomonadaceae bacterium]
MLCSTGVKFASLLALLGACATGASPEPQLTEQVQSVIPTAPAAPASPIVPAPVFSIPPFETSGHQELDAWRVDFAQRAMSAGRNPMIVYEVLRDAKPLEAYLPANPENGSSGVSSQAEFAKPIWDYIRNAASASTIDTGATRVAQEQQLFNQIDARFGVDAEVVAAIWGIETSFGGYMGDFDGPETLINMATEGRRRDLAEAELLATMRMIEQGMVTREQLIAGWAGAMGHTQFMPSTYLQYAVDLSGGNQPDVWTSRADGLGSAANYMSELGYKHDLPWGLEVKLPEGFDLIYSDGRKLPVLQWQSLGLQTYSGQPIPVEAAENARLWLPSDASGPKYLLFSNFDIFLKYNRSTSYAYAVGLLADGIAGREGPQAPWPRHLDKVSVADMHQLQTDLNTLGYEAGVPDGIMGSRTRRGLQQFQSANGYVADGFPTRELVAAVAAAAN